MHFNTLFEGSAVYKRHYHLNIMLFQRKCLKPTTQIQTIDFEVRLLNPLLPGFSLSSFFGT